MRAIHLTAFGNPAQGLEFVQIQEPAAPSPSQVLIGVEFSPIDLSDLLVVSGAYPIRPSLPSVIGNEGVGRILAVGPGVDNVAVGDRVLTPLYGHAWAERIVVPAEGLFALPADVDPQQLAMLTINPPTAGLLLSEFVDLAAGDWIVQNAANSGVGRAVIAFAKARGFKTINLVRRTELIDELKALGGDVVIVDTPEGLNLAKDALGPAAPRLAIDGVGGPSAATLINLLGRDGTLVAYAALGKAPIVISAMALIFKRVSVRGFFLSDPEHAAKIAPLIVEAAELLRSGRLHAPVEQYVVLPFFGLARHRGRRRRVVGRLRQEFGALPPGDLRMALAALCGDDEWGTTWARVVQHRFGGDGDLSGHSLGNLLIAGLWDLLGDPVAGLDWVGRLLRVTGRVLPMAAVPMDIVACVDGLDAALPAAVTTVRGQAAVAVTPGRVQVDLAAARRPARRARGGQCDPRGGLGGVRAGLVVHFRAAAPARAVAGFRPARGHLGP